MKNDSDVLKKQVKKNHLTTQVMEINHWNAKNILLFDLPEKIADIESQIIDKGESDVSEGQGLKIIITSNIIDLYTRIKIPLGKSLYGHTDKLTKASNLIDKLHKRGVKQNEQQYRNVFDKFYTI